MPIYLAQWTWVESPDGEAYWQMPRADIGLGCLDLRSLPQCGSPGPVPQGFGLFSLREPDSKVGVLVADSLTSGLTLQTRRAVGTALGIGRDALTQAVDNPLALILQLYNRHADATGSTRWKPLRGSLRGGLKLTLENKPVYQAPLDATVLANTVAVFQADYRRNKAEGMKLETLRKWTGSTVRKLYGPKSDAEYDQLAAQILPPEFATDGQQRPTTVIPDDFNRADEQLDASANWTTIDGTATQFNIVSNQLKYGPSASGYTAVRYDGQALSSDDMYSQLSVVNRSGTVVIAGLITRANDGADGGDYYAYLIRDGFPSDYYRIFRFVNGVATQLALVAEAQPAYSWTLYGEVNSSDAHSLRVNGVEKATASDGVITGNFYGGVFGEAAQEVNRYMLFDDFEEGDLGAAGIAPAVAMYHHRHHNKAG